jgi:hypothetical protein
VGGGGSGDFLNAEGAKVSQRAQKNTKIRQKEDEKEAKRSGKKYRDENQKNMKTGYLL